MAEPIEVLKAQAQLASPAPWRERQFGAPHPTNGRRQMICFEAIYEQGFLPQSPEHRANLLLCETLRNLAAELIALWEAAERQKQTYDQLYLCHQLHGESHEITEAVGNDHHEAYEAFRVALDALNAQAREEVHG